MAEPERKNHNVAWMMGQDIDDLEVCQNLGLDPSVAYTPEINKAAVDAVYISNIEDGIKSGLSEEEAMAIAKKQRNDAHKLHTSLVKNYKFA